MIQIKLPLLNVLPSVVCEDVEDLPDMAGKAVGLQRGNCTFSEKATIVQDRGGKVALIVSKEPHVSLFAKYPSCTAYIFSLELHVRF